MKWLRKSSDVLLLRKLLTSYMVLAFKKATNFIVSRLLNPLCANVALIKKPVYHYMRAILYYMRAILLYYNYDMRATLALNGLNYIIKRCCQKIKFR